MTGDCRDRARWESPYLLLPAHLWAGFWFHIKNCYRNYSRIQLLLRDHLIVWDSIHGQDFQAPPACTNVLLATAKRSLPDSELGYNDSQKKLGNFSLPFVVRMKPVEIANYYCPEKQTKQGDAGYLCVSG